MHAFENPRRSRRSEASVTRKPMRWRLRRDVDPLKAAGAAMLERACSTLDRLSSERQIHVNFEARLGAVGLALMQYAATDEAARHHALHDEAKGILRKEGKRKRQIDRRCRNS